MNALSKASSVVTYPDRQFRTGPETQGTSWLPETVYNQALDALVIACVDVIPVYRGRILIGRRRWQPQADWWVFGGRMRKGELYQQAAARNAMRELFYARDHVILDPDRFRMVGIYNLIWDQRAQSPSDAGCQTISIAMMVRLLRQEIHDITPNDEYSEVRWIPPTDIVASADHHPCLAQMAKDTRRLLDDSR